MLTWEAIVCIYVCTYIWYVCMYVWINAYSCEKLSSLDLLHQVQSHLVHLQLNKVKMMNLKMMSSKMSLKMIKYM